MRLSQLMGKKIINIFDGDILEALIPGQQPISLMAKGLQNGEGEPIASAPHATMSLRLPFPHILPVGTYLRKRIKD